jgi:hypothetical protein
LDIRFKTNKASFKNVAEFMDAIGHYEQKLGPVPLLSTPSQKQNDPSTNSATPVSISATTQSSSKKIKISALYGGVLEAEPSVPGTKEERLRAEIQRFISIPRLTADEMDELDILAWWKERQNDFPQLALVARQVLGIVATSAPSERVFSTGGNVVTQLRQRLDPQNVDKLIFLNQNSAPKKK